MSTKDHETEASAVAAIAREHFAADIKVVEHPTEPGLKATLIILPDESGALRYSSLKGVFDAERTHPVRRTGTAEMTTLKSFIAHVQRFKDEHSVVFADTMTTKTPSLLAVLDYHEQGAKGSPRFGHQRVTYKFPFSNEWAIWTARSGATNAMSQAAFAEFIEDRLPDVQHPGEAGIVAQGFADQFGRFASPSELLALSREFTVRVGSHVKVSWNPSTGETEAAFAASHGDAHGQPLAVPRQFLIGIPVFRGGDRYQLCVRLRYRADASSGNVAWFYELHRVQESLDDNIATACHEVHTETGLPVHFGKPEA